MMSFDDVIACFEVTAIGQTLRQSAPFCRHPIGEYLKFKRTNDQGERYLALVGRASQQREPVA